MILQCFIKTDVLQFKMLKILFLKHLESTVCFHPTIFSLILNVLPSKADKFQSGSVFFLTSFSLTPFHSLMRRMRMESSELFLSCYKEKSNKWNY